MKMWAKENDINSSKDCTMSSMTIIALVAFHLQVLNDIFHVLILMLFCNCNMT
jgi:DNA polymerase sigma